MNVETRTSPARRRALALAAALLPAAALAGLGATSLASQETAPRTEERIAGARTTLERWYEARQVLSRERRDWAIARETLQGRIDVVQGEIDSLRQKLADARRGLGESDEKRLELQRENERLAATTASLGQAITALEARTKELLARLPDPIRERVRPLSQRIPDDPASARLGERFQNVVGILNEVNEFNGEITVLSEVRTLPDGAAAEVTSLYLGIGQAYYVSGDGRSAGIGTAGPEGWTWRRADEAAPAIRQAIAILSNEAVASFVPLPLEVR